MRKAIEVKLSVRSRLKDNPNVMGVGVTWDAGGEPAILVNVKSLSAAGLICDLPVTIDGVPIMVEQTKTVQLQSEVGQVEKADLRAEVDAL